MSYNTVTHIHSSEFKNNTAKIRGGAFFCDGSLLIFYEICTLSDNHAELGGAIYLCDNTQCFITHGATVVIANNSASDNGGGIYLDGYSHLTLDSYSKLQILENRASADGGGVYLSHYSHLTIHDYGKLLILENRASADGGGAYLNLHSHLILHRHSVLKVAKNRATQGGGGIYMYISKLSIIAAANLYTDNGTNSTTINFLKNKASRGGGLYLEFNSIVYIFKCQKNTIFFHKNSAKYGEAVYISSLQDPVPECVFQPLPYRNITTDTDPGICGKENDYAIQFSLNNIANNSGTNLFKSIFDKCSVNGKLFDELTLINSMSNIQISDIGSFQVQICYCENSILDCTKLVPFIDVKTGDKIILDIAIADRGYHPVNGSIKSNISGHILIRDDQKFHNVINGCTPLTFDIYSFKYSQQLVISPQFEEGSFYITTESSKRTIKLNFVACIECPIGFQKTNNDVKGKCFQIIL